MKRADITKGVEIRCHAISVLLGVNGKNQRKRKVRKMTYKQYLDSCDDEFERAVIIINLARKYPNYDKLTPLGKRRKLKEILDQEINIGCIESEEERCR